MRWRAIAIRTAILSALWWVLTGGSAAAWGVGVVSVAGAMALSLVLHPLETRGISLTALPGFLAFFLMQSVKSGVQVAVMAMRPRLNLQPVMLEIRLRLPDESSRVLLASTLSLLPGTLSAGLTGDRLLLHILNWRPPVEQGVRNAEAHVARLLGVKLQ